MEFVRKDAQTVRLLYLLYCKEVHMSILKLCFTVQWLELIIALFYIFKYNFIPVTFLC